MASVRFFDTAKRDIAAEGWDSWVANNKGAVRAVTQAASPVDKGGLKGGHNVSLEPGGPLNTRKLRVTASARYADIVALGSRPHDINAKPGGVLSWLDKLSGDRRYAKKVRHPGTRPTWWMVEALQAQGLRSTKAAKNPGARGD